MPDGQDGLFPDYTYDVAISYSRRDEALVRHVADRLVARGIRVFMDTLDHIAAELLGRDLAVELPRIYQKDAAYCVIVVSEHYRSDYARAELRAALRRLLESPDYILPVRLDDAVLEDLPESVAYADARPGGPFARPEALLQLLERAIRLRAGAHGSMLMSEAPEPGAQASPAQAPAKPDEDGLAVQTYFNAILPSLLQLLGERAADIDAVVRFVVTGEGGGTWVLVLKTPVPHVALGWTGKPDLTIKITQREMRNMLRGEFDARAALIEGNVELNGNLLLLKDLGELFQSNRGTGTGEDDAAGH